MLDDFGCLRTATIHRAYADLCTRATQNGDVGNGPFLTWRAIIVRRVRKAG
jgi:hypothetical protein